MKGPINLGKPHTNPNDTAVNQSFQCRDGFSLLEIILVVAIIIIASAIAIPSFMRSYEGARLNASARSIAMASKYARNMAVLQQTQMAVLFDTRRNELEIVSNEQGVNRHEQEIFLHRRSGFYERRGNDVRETSISSLLTRSMENGVRIVEVSDLEGGHQYGGVYWVNYYPGGFSDKYSVLLSDERGRTLRMHVDYISGSFSIEH